MLLTFYSSLALADCRSDIRDAALNDIILSPEYSALSQLQFEAISNEQMQEFALAKVWIAGGKVDYVVPRVGDNELRIQMLLPALSEVARSDPSLKLKFILSVGDAVDDALLRRYPNITVFAPNYNPLTQRGRVIAIPDYYLLNSVVYDVTLNKIAALSKRIPFANKIAKANFAGSDVGDARQMELNQSPRRVVKQLAVEHPQYINVNIIQPSGLVERLSQRMSFEDQLAYKYLLSLDGNAATWLRPIWIMNSNSLLLMKSSWYQYFYPALKNGVNYVEIAPSLADLPMVIKDLEGDSSKVQGIIDNANATVATCFNNRAIIEDLHYILKNYQEMKSSNIVVVINEPSLNEKYMRFIGYLKYQVYNLKYRLDAILNFR